MDSRHAVITDNFDLQDFDLDLTDLEPLSSSDSSLSALLPPKRRSNLAQPVAKRRKSSSKAPQQSEGARIAPVQPPGLVVKRQDNVFFASDFSPILYRYLFCPPASMLQTVETFPHCAAKCLNSGDFCGLAELVNAHLDQYCDISVSYSHTKLNGQTFVQLFELLNEIHPDRIMSVHNAEISSNRVAAKLYMKFTDCKPLYEAVARSIKNPTFEDYFPQRRADILKRRMRTASRPDGERQRLEALLESDCDIVVYGCVQLVLTLDEVTRKGVGMQLLCDFSSSHVANENCY